MLRIGSDVSVGSPESPDKAGAVSRIVNGGRMAVNESIDEFKQGLPEGIITFPFTGIEA